MALPQGNLTLEEFHAMLDGSLTDIHHLCLERLPGVHVELNGQIDLAPGSTSALVTPPLQHSRM